MTKEEATKVYQIIRMAQDYAMLSVTGVGLQGFTSLEYMGDRLKAEASAQYTLWTNALENLTGMTIDDLEEAQREL